MRWRKQGVPSYLDAEDLTYLDSVLFDCLEQLTQSGVLHAQDRDFERVRLQLAAVLVAEASAGACDRSSLMSSAMRFLEVDQIASA